MTSYDAVPYPSLPVRRTHVSQLAAMARLFGLESPAPRCCRVLELGCASGGNLLPMAADLPESSFLGIDASAAQVAEGQAHVQAAGLRNIEIRHLDLMRFPADSPQFDYILCHGVYSWVPPPIQEQILAIARRHLHADGVFYVSYNTYPGWHMRGVVRDMMRYHVRRFDDPRTKIIQSRLLLDFLVNSAAGSSEAYRQVLRDEAAILAGQGDAYLFHEHLEDDNEPLYFHQFTDRAAAAGLQYLADADFSTMLSANFGQEIAVLLKDAPRLAREQYLDFLRNRTFRCSLLCHAERALADTTAVGLTTCDLALEERLEMPPAPLENDAPLICHSRHEELTAVAPLTKAALAALNEVWPACLSYDELLRAAEVKLATTGRQIADDDKYRRRLADDLVTMLSRRLLRISFEGPSCRSAPSDCAQATSLARWQATRTDGVTNRRHEHVLLNQVIREVLQHLDGRHDRPALIEMLRQAAQQGDFEIRRDGQPLQDIDDATLGRLVDHALNELAEKALLIA
jgi:methyltransferase-like protein/ubiquinone/menaquinone biosynthesis C-methylase UbiE